MILLSKVAFIHVPKTAGMSLTRYLVNDAKGPITISIPHAAYDHCRQMIEFSDVEPRLTLVPGTRHETIPMAEERAEALHQSLKTKIALFVTAREPSQLIRSYYHHFRKPHVIRRNTDNGARPLGPNHKLAVENDYGRFVAATTFVRLPPERCAEYFTSSNKILSARIVVIPMERLGDFIRCLQDIGLVYGRYKLPKRNSTHYPPSDPIREAELGKFVNRRFNELYDIWRRSIDKFDAQMERLKRLSQDQCDLDTLR